MSGLSRMDVSALLPALVPLLVMGVTLFLALGCILVWIARSPVHRQRLGEMTLLAVLLWSVLALVPLPRLLPELTFLATADTTESLAAVTSKSLASTAESFRSNASLETNESWQATVDLNPAMANAQFPDLDNLQMTEAEQLKLAEGRTPAWTGAHSVPAIPNRIGAQLPRLALVAQTGQDSSTSAVTGPIQFTSLRILFGLYLAGTSACVLWLTIGQVLLLRIRQQAQRPEPWLAELFQTLQPESSKNMARLIISSRCARAMSWGIWRPIIVLPQSLCHRHNYGQLRTILLHELGHVAQRDAWGNVLICLTSPLLYLHPLFWWLRVQIRLSAELIADDWAAQQTGKEAYVEQLVALAKVTAGRGILLPGVTGVLSSPSQFYRRMNMLLAREEPLLTRPTVAWRLTSIGAWIIAVGLATSIAGIHPAVGQATAEAPAVEGTHAATTQPKAEPPQENPTPTTPVPPTTAPVANPPVGVATPVEVKNPQPVPGYPIPPYGLRSSNPDSEKAHLRNVLRQIQERLRALDQHESAYYTALGAPVTGDGKTVTVIRVDGEGKTVTETWTVDESGKPSKLITRDQTSLKLPNVIHAQPSIQAQPPGRASRIVAEYKVEDGKNVVKYYSVGPDGEKSEIKPSPAAPEGTVPPPPTAANPNVSLYGSAKRRPVEVRVAQAAPPIAYPGKAASRLPGEDQSGSSQQLDLVTLATSYADAVGALESAKANLASIEPAAKAAAISASELTTAKVTLQNAERKEGLLRRIITTSIATARMQRESLQKQNSPDSQQNLIELTGRLEILEAILGSQSSGSGTSNETKPSEIRGM